MTLFLRTIGQDCAGVAGFSLPDSHGGYVVVEGYLTEDPQISLKNNWEALIPDLGAINDFMQIADLGTTSWISTSKATWKGTDPLTVTLTFYLITNRMSQIRSKNGTGPDMPVTVQASYFARLCALSPADKAGSRGNSGMFDTLSVNVHGGYVPNFFQRNNEFSGKTINEKNEASARAHQMFNGDLSGVDLSNSCEGTIQIVINGGGRPTLYFTKMLLADITFNPSTVRAGYWSGDTFITSSEPLYIRCQATFRLMHATTVEDATRLFTGGTTLANDR